MFQKTRVRDRISRPKNPADIRLAELERQEREDQEWASKAGPVVVQKIDPVKLHINEDYVAQAVRGPVYGR